MRTKYLKYEFGEGTIDADLKEFGIWDYIHHLFLDINYRSMPNSNYKDMVSGSKDSHL